MQHPDRRPDRAFLPLLLLAALAAACSSGGSDGDGQPLFKVNSTATSFSNGSEVLISDRFVAYLADEATTAGGTDLNGDGDTVDAVATVIDSKTRNVLEVGIAAYEMHWLGTELFLLVDEAQDGKDWNGDGGTGALDAGDSVSDRALVHWSPASMQASFLATLGADLNAVRVGERLYFVDGGVGQPGPGATNLSYVSESAPLTVVPVMTSWPGAGLRAPRPFHVDEGMLFVALDETREGQDLNGDGVEEAFHVLALLDGASAGDPVLHVVGLALANLDAPLRALRTGTADWLVAFLVSEAAQPEPQFGMGWNNPALFLPTWQPSQCAGDEDTDVQDQVLFWLGWADFLAVPGYEAVNTGLVGTDRVLAVPGWVGTISSEGDEGGCDLNQDGDAIDRIPRWVEARDASAPPLPPGHPDLHLIALPNPGQVPGGTGGFAELQGRFAMLIDEARDDTDYDGKPNQDHRLLAWLDPDGSNQWVVNHGIGQADFFGGASWLAETPDRQRLLAALMEQVEDTNFNGSPTAPGRPDTDSNDSVAGFPRIVNEQGGERMLFLFSPYAVSKTNPGMVVAKGIGFYRVSEFDDSFDWNGDGDLADFALLRTDLTSGVASFMGSVSGSPRPVIEYDRHAANPVAGAFVASEVDEGEDLNGDGDQTDLVLRYFRM